MQHRQQIREQFGLLEEKLEELGTLTSARDPSTELLVNDALGSLRELSRLVHDQQLTKSVPAHDFLLRVSSLLVQDAAAQGMDIAVSHFGEGRISLEMAELVMGAIMAGFRASLRGHRGVSKLQRVKNHLFATSSVYLEVRATASEFQFRLLDDGQGFAGDGTGRRFQKLREHVAKAGGWFGHRSFSPCGGLIELKVPLASARTESLVLRRGAFEVLLPSSYVAETVRAAQPPEGSDVWRLHETNGLEQSSKGCLAFLRIGVADMQFWIGCETISGPIPARRASAEGFVEEGCWMRTLGIFQDGGTSRTLPLLDGPTLLQYRDSHGGET